MSGSDPISRIFFVTAKENVSQSGEGIIARILACTQRGHDGDLFESSWRHKGTRFLCYEKDPNASFVITDMSVMLDDEQVPNGYCGIFLTEDTNQEKSLKKHVVCIKKEPRQSVTTALTDITLVNRSKGEQAGPGFYTITNEVNDIQITFAVASIAPSTQVGKSPSVDHRQMEIPVRAGDNNSRSTSNNTQSGVAPSSPVSALDGIPFQLNPKFGFNNATHDPLMASLKILTIEDISNQFDYPFSVEKDAVKKS